MATVAPSSKQLSNELHAIQSPSDMFKEIENVLQKLKHDYSCEWDKREQFQKKAASTTDVDEILSYIKGMKQLKKTADDGLKSLLRLIKKSNQIPPRSRPCAQLVDRVATRARSRSNSRSSTRNSIIGSARNSLLGNIDIMDTIKDEIFDTLDLPSFLTPTLYNTASSKNFGDFYDKQYMKKIARTYRDSIQLHIEDLEHAFHNDDDEKDPKTDNKIMQFYHDNYLGQNEIFESPFGIRPVIYCDWTASGKSLQCVEKYIEEELLTLYANTHTTTSITGIQTSKFRTESRSIILQSLGGDVDEDVVVFTGSGVTGAIYKVANVLMKSAGGIYAPESSIVFVSVYEHNSNLYIWKELGFKVIVIPEDTDNPNQGGIDLKLLKQYLELYTSEEMKLKYNLLIGSFTAASNVSGIIASVDETTALLHEYKALSFWDFATAGPYLDIAMTNKEKPELSKDAVFISTHKFLAGPGAPGILCAKKQLFSNYVPVIPGGGTVFIAYGTENGEWEYLDNIEEREEGGTPDIVGSIRAAFAFLIKDHLSTRYIERREKQFLDYFIKETKDIKNLLMMGNMQCNRLPVLSFLVSHTKNKGLWSKESTHMTTKYLHYNFIAALFNDLFGIQGRGGCACAGMYGVQCLEIGQEQIQHVVNEMKKKNELARPGYFRINLHYTLTVKELEYIVSAVKYVCNHGWKFLPLYDVDSETGNYYHRDIKRKPELLKQQLRSLLDVSFDEENGEMKWTQKHLKMSGQSLQDNLMQFFTMANDILEDLNEYLPSKDEFGNEKEINDARAWYWLPSELYQDVCQYAAQNN